MMNYKIILKQKQYYYKTIVENGIKLDKLDYKNYNFNKVLLPTIFLRDVYTNDLSIENAVNEQSDLFKTFSNLNKGRKSSEKSSFLKNVKILLKAREEHLSRF